MVQSATVRHVDPAWHRSYRWLIWAGPLVFLVHDYEEILTVERWIQDNIHALPGIMRPLAASITTASFAASVVILAFAFVACSWHGTHALREGRTPWLALFCGASLFANAIGHIAQALVFGGYVPGVVTAVVVCIPFGLYGYARCRDARVIADRRRLLVLVIASLALQPFLAALVLQLGRLLVA